MKVKLKDDIESNCLEMNSIETSEYNILVDTVKRYKGNLKATAEALNLSRNTIYRKLDKFGIDYKKYR